MPKPIQAGSGSSGQDRRFSQAEINPSTGARKVAVTEPGAIKIRPQKIRGKSPKSGETSNPLISGNFAEACSGSNWDFEVEFRTVREAKAESSSRELRVRQLLLIDGLEGLTHPAFKFAAVAATGKEEINSLPHSFASLARWQLRQRI